MLSEINTPKNSLDTDHALVQACPCCNADVMVVQSVHGMWSQAFDVDACDAGGYAVWESDDERVWYRKISDANTTPLDDETRHNPHRCASSIEEYRASVAACEASPEEIAQIVEDTLASVAESIGITLHAPAYESDAHDLLFSRGDALAMGAGSPDDDEPVGDPTGDAGDAGAGVE